MPSDVDRFFQDYVESFNRALADRAAVEEIQAYFTDCFIGAGPKGVDCGRTGAAFIENMRKGYDFYTSIGTKTMALRGVTMTQIDASHQMATVDYRATYEKSSGEVVEIDFAVTYFLTSHDETLKIFGFVSGDEMAVYRDHGLIAG
jgi:hypothetical protein